jgi:DUF2934 family protein
MAQKKSSNNGNGSAAKPLAKRKTRKTPAESAAVPAPRPVSDEEIAMRAYALWESRGKPLGSPDEDWHNATQQIRGKS